MATTSAKVKSATLTIGGRALQFDQWQQSDPINNTEGMLTVTGVNGPTVSVYTVNYTYTLEQCVDSQRSRQQ